MTRVVLAVLGSLAVLLVFTSACQALHDRWFSWDDDPDATLPLVLIVQRQHHIYDQKDEP